MNSLNITANLGKNAEQRFTPKGESIIQFTAAFKAGYGDNEITTWINCSLWGKRGESLLPYLNKGAQVALTGELANRPWTDKNGKQKYSLDLRVSDVTLLGSKSDARQAAESKPQSNEQNTGFDDFNDDIPF